jgi:glutaredoxin
MFPLLMVLALSLSARADTIVLKGGVTHQGAVLAETDSEISVLSGGIEWVFKTSDVQSIKRDKATADRELTARKARRERRETEEAARAQRAIQARAVPPPRSVTPSKDNAAVFEPSTTADVVVYGTTWCGFCSRAKAYFRSKGIAFQDKDVEADPKANQEMLRKCSQVGMRPNGVPVIDVYGTMISGFDVRRIEEALAKRRW